MTGRRGRVRPNPEQRPAAVKRVLALLERRWRSTLPDGRFPAGFLKELRHHGFFQGLVQSQMESDAVRLPSLETMGPRELYDRMLEELGGDPADHICVDCHDEIPKGEARCRPCAQWRKTGAAR